ncbi:MAG: hypothetical protein JSS27_18585 [Planctomycetes bacterium]|nr:hypothetical protein [Planctomycetota bacterium]
MPQGASAQEPISYPMVMDLAPLAAQIGKTSEHTLSARYNLDGASQVLVTGPGVRGTAILPEPPAAPVLAAVTPPASATTTAKPTATVKPQVTTQTVKIEAKKPTPEKKADTKKDDGKKAEAKKEEAKKSDVQQEPAKQPAAATAKPQAVAQKAEPKQADDAKKIADDKRADDAKKVAEQKKAEPAKPAPEVKKPAEPPKVADKKPVPKIKLKFDVAADQMPGVRDFRVVTPQGVSTLGQLVLTNWPVVGEQPKNDAPADAQKFTLPACLCGAIEKAEDVDYYKFHVEAGTTLVFHCRAARCEDRIHDLQIHVDPIITLRNEQGTVVASGDNFFFADPAFQYRFEHAGDYTLEIRDVRYQGNIYWQYAVEVADAPLVTAAFPSAVPPGKTTSVELLGFHLPPAAKASVTIPADVPDGPTWVTATLDGGKRVGPVPVVVSRLPLSTVTADNHTLTAALPVTAPAAVCGRVAQPGEIDYFTFEAKKGEAFTFEVLARRHQSSLDPVLAVLNDKGARLLENDDVTIHRFTYGDSLIENWTAPADGRYTLELRDLFSGGSPTHVYLLSVTRSQPFFTLHVDSDKALLAPGLSAALFVRVYRKNGFAGEIKLTATGLPTGVTAECGRILPGENDGCIVLTAADNAALGAANIRIAGTGRHNDAADAPQLSAVAVPWQETYLPGGGRGLMQVEMLTVSVGAPFDLRRVNIKPEHVTLKPGESKPIEITIERAPGFNKNVSLDLIYRHLGGISGNSLPAGVTIDDKKSKTLLTGEQTSGVIVLTTAKDAKPVADQIVPVQAHVSVNFVMKMSYTAKPLRVTVEK